jgi:hypothetical protein
MQEKADGRPRKRAQDEYDGHRIDDRSTDLDCFVKDVRTFHTFLFNRAEQAQELAKVIVERRIPQDRQRQSV